MGKILDRNKFKAERSGVFAQGVLTAAKMFFVEDPQELRVERATITEHGKENASEFVSGGGDGCRGTESGTKTAKIVTQRRAAAIQSGRGHAQAIGEPAAHVAGFGREDFAPADAVIRTKPQPGGKVP